MTSSNCVFCGIAEGSIPSLRVLETSEAVAFLDVGPLAPGHCLLVPRHHCRSILDVPADVLSALAAQLPKLAAAVLEATGATGLNILQNTGESSGQAVFHLHFHLIPRVDGDRLGYRWNAGAYEPGEAELIQARVLGELKE